MDASLYENHTNSSLLYAEETLLERYNRYVQVLILFILAVLGFFLNIVIIITLYNRHRNGSAYSNIDLLIFHLTISDLLVAGFCCLTDAAWKMTYSWLAGDLMCRIIKHMQMFSLYASTFIVVCISLDRCIAIVNPIPRFDSQTTVKVLIRSAWLLAFVCGLPQILIFRVEKAPFTVDDKELFQCVTHGAYSEEWQETAYVVFTFFVIFAIPLLIITLSYTLIFIRLNNKTLIGVQRKSELNRIHSDTSTTGRYRVSTMKRAKKNALWISLLVIVTFVICWAPYHFAMIYFVMISHAHTTDSADIINTFQHIFFFGMSTSILNPILYGAFHFVRKKQGSRESRDDRGRRRSSNLENHNLGKNGCNGNGWNYTETELSLASSYRPSSQRVRNFHRSRNANT
ncbi:hypothetical protein RvY_07874 [Ramazzottius varieornatus]|uniref:G-protein coupled receptors family 1 profile domain-containing protein n=1 Tax=Ramazzottius varieornatus TaxID=947166 RepID=A0A1D1V6M7_RAMVA|nr:hypothetical protein RvY_07874 [Ramazzottius varieornatus]